MDGGGTSLTAPVGTEEEGRGGGFFLGRPRNAMEPKEAIINTARDKAREALSPPTPFLSLSLSLSPPPSLWEGGRRRRRERKMKSSSSPLLFPHSPSPPRLFFENCFHSLDLPLVCPAVVYPGAATGGRGLIVGCRRPLRPSLVGGLPSGA